MGNQVFMQGNQAMAESAIRAGCKLFFGYPITPQTELSEYMAKHMPKRGGLSLQAESEIAAINMVLGASAAGARVITSSSSPGISLKSEGISYIVGSDLPCVIVNVQRAGPGLGGIQPSQADYFQATKALGHGDMHFIVLAPASVQEIATLTGGRAAEEVVFHSVTTGASNDIEQATKLARAMITRYGMSDDFDMVALETVNNQYLGGDASLACSAETQTKIDQRVVELVKKQHEKAVNILTENRAKLDELAQYLYEKETITGEEFMNIVNAK